MRVLAGIVLLLAASSASPVRAELITAGQTVIHSTAIQDITLLAGTPFNDTGADIFIPDVTGVGLLTLNRNKQDGTTIEIPSLTGVYTGSNPGLGNFRFGTLSEAGEAAFSGSITNVIQDPNDPGFASGNPSSFASGDYQVSGNFFEFELVGGPAFTTGPVTFNSVFDGLPPSLGTIISGGNDPVDIFFDGAAVGFSTNRRILVTAIPEPTSTAVLLGITSIAALRIRRQLRAK